MCAPGSAAAQIAAAAPVLAPKYAERRVQPAGLLAQPSGHVAEPGRERLDIEHVRPVEFLVGGQQVEQERSQPGLVELLGYEPVARAVPAAPAAMDEDHGAGRVRGAGEMPGKRDRPAVDLQFHVLVPLWRAGGLPEALR